LEEEILVPNPAGEFDVSAELARSILTGMDWA